jgi:hypothetical protein
MAQRGTRATFLKVTKLKKYSAEIDWNASLPQAPNEPPKLEMIDIAYKSADYRRPMSQQNFLGNKTPIAYSLRDRWRDQ